MKLHRVSAMVGKEWVQIIKDPSSIITAFIFPLLLLFLYGKGVSLDMKDLKIGVVLEDSSPLARSLTDAFRYSDYFDADVMRHTKEAEEKLGSGTIKGFVVIPSNFSVLMNHPNRIAPLQSIADGSEPNTAQFVQNYIKGAWMNWSAQQEKLTSSVQISPRVWFNEVLESHYFLVPGSIVVIITVTGALLTSMVVAREWERGTMEGLMATPVSMKEIILSKFLAYLILGVGSLTLCILVSRFIYGVPLRGSLFALGLASLSYIIFALGMGLLISFFARNQFAAAQIAIVATYLPSFILSGFIFDIESMPLYLRFITYFVPARYFVENLKTIFLAGDVWELLIPNIIITNVFSLLIYLIIAKKAVKILD